MMFGDLVGLKLFTGEEKPRKNLAQETCPDRGSNPGPLRDRRACFRQLYSGEHTHTHTHRRTHTHTHTHIYIYIFNENIFTAHLTPPNHEILYMISCSVTDTYFLVQTQNVDYLISVLKKNK